MLMLQVAGGILLALAFMWALQAIRNFDWNRDVRGWKAAAVIVLVFGLTIVLPFVLAAR